MPNLSNNTDSSQVATWNPIEGCECDMCEAARRFGRPNVPTGTRPSTSVTPPPEPPSVRVLVSTITEPEEPRTLRTFGAELETEWDDLRSPANAGYHSRNSGGAPAPYLPNWQATGDGSLSNGCEFVSPILSGVAGLVEVAATMDRVKERGGAVMDSCGAHVHIGRNRSDQPVKVQLLALVMEEAGFALTGAYRRLTNSTYARRIKENDHVSHELVRSRQVAGDRYLVCNVRASTYEFRHPPGTLSIEQFTLNLAFAQMVVALSHRLDDAQLTALVSESMRAHARGDLHHTVRFGLAKIAELAGWTLGGEWLGLPYRPSRRPEYELKTERDGKTNRVVLPGEVQLLDRIERQLTHFYRRMNKARGLADRHDLDEALAAFGFGRSERTPELAGR